MSLSKIVCLTFFLFGIATFAVNAELVAYWSFDKADGVDDLTGNGHDGNIHGNPKVVAGKFGNEAISVEDSMDPLPVKPGRKLTTTWGSIKTLR